MNAAHLHGSSVPHKLTEAFLRDTIQYGVSRASVKVDSIAAIAKTLEKNWGLWTSDLNRRIAGRCRQTNNRRDRSTKTQQTVDSFKR